MKRIFLLTLVFGTGCLGLNAQTSWSATSLDGNTYRNGNVGIGTNSPQNIIHIKRNSTTGLHNSSDSRILGVYENSEGARILLGTSSTGGSVINFGDTEAWNAGEIYYDHAQDQMRFRVNNANRIVILNNGETNFIGEIVAPVIRLDDEIRIAENFSASDPSIGTLDNSGYGINISKTYGIGFSLSNSHKMIINPEGKVGIGIEPLGWQLSVKNNIALNGSSNQFLHIRPNSGYDGYIYWAENGVAERGVLGFNAGSGDLIYKSGANNFTNGVERFRIASNGNVGIGTSSPDYPLDVEGTIRGHEIKVDLNEGGADFVFEEDYNLMPLNELEAFVKTQKHLPEVAPAKDMEAEGLSISEMNIKLLQKIEELTLYVIELKKENEEQNKRIQLLEKSDKN